MTFRIGQTFTVVDLRTVITIPLDSPKQIKKHLRITLRDDTKAGQSPTNGRDRRSP
jgi:hypothetical protein